MCTAVTYKTKDHYFGRNLDLEYSYHETVTITPRNYEFRFRKTGALKTHYAIIGMAYVVDDYPLYYDATNERGLSMAGLNFPGNAHYQTLDNAGAGTTMQGAHESSIYDRNVTSIINLPRSEYTLPTILAPFEFIPFLLGQCATVAEAKTLLDNVILADIPFSKELPNTPLHWMIADRECAIVVEPGKDGLRICDNPVGILANNPPFPQQLFQLNNYMGLSAEMPQNHFSDKLDLEAYSRGMGALGLPGDLSSQSRFVRAAFVKQNSLSEIGEGESVSQFFHILSSVEQQRGCVHIKDDQYEITVYSSCCNTDKGIYYYTTYDNRQITGVDMHKVDLDGSVLTNYPLRTEQQIFMEA